MSLTIERLELGALADEELRRVFEFDRAIDAEVQTEGPAPVWGDWSFRVRNRPTWRPQWSWAAFDGDDLVALFWAELDDSGSNRTLAEIFGGVHPARRREGIARSMYDVIRRDLVAGGRTLHTFHARDGAAPAESFISGLGATKRLVERRSRCQLARIDRSMLEEWVARAPQRAADYELFVFSAPTPDDAIERWADLQLVMNTAPLDDLEYEDERVTPEMIRESEGRMAAMGRTNRVVVASHVPSGAWAGFSELDFNPHYPMMAVQEGTGVVPAHRDRGLGRWVKAANALWLLDERPDVEYIDTWNAFSNAPMLGINDAMGFEVVGAYAAWQLSAA